MGAPDISIDAASLTLLIEDHVLKLFGRDPETTEWNARLSRRMRLAVEHARFIQCVGMTKPININDIFQQVSLRQAATYRTVSVWELIQDKSSAVIFAGPGFGKSTLLSYMCLQLLNKPSFRPFLFVLRSANAVDDLQEFVARFSAGKRPKALAKAETAILLIDGYDEITTEDRRRVSEALSEFHALKVGPYYLTCRSFYDVYDIKANHFEIIPFTTNHQKGFIQAFSRNYEIAIDADQLVSQLNERGLQDLAAHPLTLTLVCILRCGSFPDVPDNALALLKRAFDMLTLRWDQQKGVAREAQVPLDGEERIRCLMRIAYKMCDLQESQENVERFVREHLRLSQRESLDSRDVLLDTARWYGVLVPTQANTWEFVHRSIHDYLAARFWVESGSFRAGAVREWNTRVAYAACLTPNATETLVRALRECEELHVVAECLRNKPSFDTNQVADAFVYHFGRFSGKYLYRREERALHVHTTENIFALASRPLLASLIRHTLNNTCQREQTKSASFICAYALSELIRRSLRVTEDEICTRLLEVYGPTFRMIIGADESALRFTVQRVIKYT